MKKLLPAIIAVLLFIFSVQGFAYENIIDDSADLFTDIEETEILSSIESFSAETGYSLAVVTTDFTSGVGSEEYANDYHDNLIDTEGWQEDGLLFLIDMDNRNVWISTCGECISAYSDYDIDEIIDSGYDSLTNGYYSDCIISMVDAACNIGTSVYESDVNDFDYYYDDYNYYPNDNYNNSYYSSSHSISLNISDFLIYIVIGLVVGLIVAYMVKKSYKNMGKGDEFDADDITLNLTASNDTIISRNVITTRIPRNNNHHRGGSMGGGSSVHRSGGGRSHGGGGRRF